MVLKPLSRRDYPPCSLSKRMVLRGDAALSQDIFKSKFERDERIVNRNKALLTLIKTLGASNLRQARPRSVPSG